MKKFSIVLLILVYGLSSSGMSVTFHYCCGKFEKITFFQVAKKGCLESWQVSKKKCCDNKNIELKLKADQERSIKQVEFNSTYAAFKARFYNPDFLIRYQKNQVNELSTGPPLIASSVPLFIQHCIFRI